MTHGIDPLEDYKIAKSSKEKVFLRAIIIKPKKLAEEEAKNIYKLNKINLDLII